MKIVVIADTHERHRDLKVPDGDVLIHAGDLTLGGNINSLLDVNDWFGELPHKYKIVIGGNHDRRLASYSLSQKIFTNAIYLQDDAIEFEGIKFYGSPYTPKFTGMRDGLHFFKTPGDEMRKVWKRIPDDTDVLITHGPPYGILDLTTRNESAGCPELLERVIKVKPKLHIFGHIHEAYGMIKQRYGIKFVNCSVIDEDYSLTNKPMVIEY